MLCGDPSRFAISWEVVNEWSTHSSTNGVLNIYVNFTLLGNRKNIVHELGANVAELLEHIKKHRLQSSNLNLSASRLDSEIFADLHEYTFPKVDRGQPSSWQYLAAPYSVYDEGDCLFLVRLGDIDRLYYGSDTEMKGVICLPAGEYEAIVKESANLLASHTLTSD
jgi:hypothetical protein